MSSGSPTGPTPLDGEITRLLEAVAHGHEGAVHALFAATYEELKALAGAQRRSWRGDETLSTTALTHEAYLKLVHGRDPRWEHRGQFFAVASRAMRQILINYARDKRAAKRGGGVPPTSADEVPLVVDSAVEELLALDEALQELAALDGRQARVFECRFFGGLTVAETAEALDVSPATVKRDWAVARAWLRRALTPPSQAED